MWSRVLLDMTGMIQYFQMTRKWKNPPHSVHHFFCPSLQPDTKILRPRISFRVKTTGINNKYDLYSITCADGSSMIKGVYFTVSYEPVAGILSLCIIIAISYIEGLIIFVLDISNAFQNEILTNPKERVYISLQHIYMERLKRK